MLFLDLKKWLKRTKTKNKLKDRGSQLQHIYNKVMLITKPTGITVTSIDFVILIILHRL